MLDELTPIAVYMAHEMNTNARGPDSRRMAQLNAVSSEACVTEYFKASWWRKLFGAIPPQQCVDIEISSREAALMMWAIKVRQEGEWDHKPKLRKFVSGTTRSWARHAHYKTLYYYDIWSNVHYGYVGVAAGFGEGVLLDGAGLEQIGSTLLRGKWPTRSAGIEGLRAWDDATDRLAISLGMLLRARFPKHISAQALVDAIVATNGLDTQALP